MSDWYVCAATSWIFTLLTRSPWWECAKQCSDFLNAYHQRPDETASVLRTLFKLSGGILFKNRINNDYQTQLVWCAKGRTANLSRCSRTIGTSNKATSCENRIEYWRFDGELSERREWLKSLWYRSPSPEDGTQRTMSITTEHLSNSRRLFSKQGQVPWTGASVDRICF